ncbi:MAG TPA: hypothetical protein VEA37_09350 [Flavobacterium sp.]|nr:hypothetical protein [Flavobacterium sp.]
MRKKLLALILTFGLIPKIASAEGSPWTDGLVPWLLQCGVDVNDLCTLTDALATAVRLINLMFYTAGIAATALLIYGGWQMLWGGFMGDEKLYTSGKGYLGNVAIGLVIIFASFVIVNSLMVLIFNIDFRELNF